MPITTVGLDADDTLWHNETFFRLTHDRFADLLAEHGDRETIEARLAEVEGRNLRLYGYGIKGFTLSMIETAMELCDGAAPPEVVREHWDGDGDVLEIVKEILDISTGFIPARLKKRFGSR